MTLEQLRARLDEIKSEMQAQIDAGLNEEAQAKFDELEAEAKQVRANIERLERFEKESKADQQGLGRKTKATKPAGIDIQVKNNAEDDPSSGFNGLGDFALSVMKAVKGDVDDRLKVLGAPSNFHRETSSTDGYMVPTQFRNEVYELVFSEPDLLSMVDSEPTSGNSVQFLADESKPWDAVGIKAYWGSEASKFEASRLDSNGREVKLHKLHAFVTATDELLEDAPRLNNRITKGAARAINWKANEAIHSGKGTGQPLGFDASGSKVVVAKETGQNANTIVAKNVAKMYSRSQNPGGSVWIANQDTIPEFMTMTLGDQPIWTPPNSGFTQAPGGFLFGRPIMFSEQCETLGSEGDILFVDPKGYYLVRKQQGIKFSASMHLYFDYDVQAFKWTFRLGGQPYLSQPVSPNKGAATRSHYVKLAVRA